MTTSTVPAPRTPIRLRLAAHPGSGTLDGGWWPQGRDLSTELLELAAYFPPGSGRVVRVQFSPPDWDAPPRALQVDGSPVAVAPLQEDDPHVIVLTTSDGTVLRVLVVPPGMTADQGDEALLAASSDGYTHSARCLLDEVTATPDVDPVNHWTDEGGTWLGDDLLGRPGH